MNFEIPRVPSQAEAIQLENLYPTKKEKELKDKELVRSQKKVRKWAFQTEELLGVIKRHKLLKFKAWETLKADLDQLSSLLIRLNKELVRSRKKDE